VLEAYRILLLTTLLVARLLDRRLEKIQIEVGNRTNNLSFSFVEHILSNSKGAHHTVLFGSVQLFLSSFGLGVMDFTRHRASVTDVIVLQDMKRRSATYVTKETMVSLR